MLLPGHYIYAVLMTLCLLPGMEGRGLWAQNALIDGQIQYYQSQLQRRPGDATIYYRLGDAYIQKARESADMVYYDLAEQALRRALDLAPEYSKARRHLAYALYSRHAFEAAIEQARQAIALTPEDSHAYAVLGDAYLELGRYAQAQEAYEHMLRQDRSLYAYSRSSGLKSLQGDPQAAIADLQRALQAGLTTRVPSESIAWVQWQLGNEYFTLGRLAAAEVAYTQALNTYPNYHRALAGMARVRAAQQHYQEAIALYQRALAIIPQPGYAAALGDVYSKVGNQTQAQQQYALVEYIGRLNALNKVLYNRELALFYADHDLKLDVALDLARRELEARQDIYAYDVLAWVLYKNGQPQEALVAMQQALHLGTQDARLFFHAGMIAQGLGQTAQARDYLQRALALNPHFHVLHAALAQQTLHTLQEDG